MEAFKDELDHEQWQEWAAFFQLEPVGWQAMNMVGARIAYVTAQCQSRKKLRERDFPIKIGGGHSPAGERVRWEAMAIRQQIASGTYEG